MWAGSLDLYTPHTVSVPYKQRDVKFVFSLILVLKQASPHADMATEACTPWRSGLHVKTHIREAAGFALFIIPFFSQS